MAAPLPTEPMLAAAAGLRRRALRAAAYLIAKHGGEVALALAGEPALVRALGPASYGLWVASYGVFNYIRYLGTLGVDAYLLRIEVEPPMAVYDQAFTMLLLFGFAGSAIGAAVLPILQWWIHFPHFVTVALALMASMPVVLVPLVPLALLERQLEYGAVAKIEFAGRAVFYVVACALAFAAFGAWAPIAGFILGRVAVAIFVFWRAAYRPRLHLERGLAREVMRYGLSYAAAGWIWGMTALVNPLIVGHYAGPAAVAYVGFTERLVAALAFAKGASMRLSMPLLARFQHDRARLSAALSEGIRLQVMLVAPCLLAGSFATAAIIPILHRDWAPLIQIYPFVATTALVGSIFILHSSTMHVLGRNYAVGIFHLVYVLALSTASLILVRKFGWLGYGWAQLAAIPAFAVIHLFVKSEAVRVRYGAATAIAATTAFALYWQSLGPLAFAGLALLLIHPGTRRLYPSYFAQIRTSFLDEADSATIGGQVTSHAR